MIQLVNVVLVHKLNLYLRIRRAYDSFVELHGEVLWAKSLAIPNSAITAKLPKITLRFLDHKCNSTCRIGWRGPHTPPQTPASPIQVKFALFGLNWIHMFKLNSHVFTDKRGYKFWYQKYSIEDSFLWPQIFQTQILASGSVTP